MHFIDWVPRNLPPSTGIFNSNENRDGLALMGLLVLRNKCLLEVVTSY